MRRSFSAVAVFGATLLALVACSSSAPGPSGRNEQESLTVFAAASLSGVFETIGEEYERQHPGVDVTFNFAGSSDLAAQIVEGAPADVFAAADEATMDAVSELAVEPPAVFATNTLTLAVPPGNPANVGSLDDLAGDPRVVVCAPQVPCGAATGRLLAVSDVTLSPASEESSVTDVLAKVTSGEADAGIVYRTDIVRAGSAVEEVPIAGARDVVNRYPIAALSDSASARSFTAFVLGDHVRSLLEDAGFGAAR